MQKETKRAIVDLFMFAALIGTCLVIGSDAKATGLLRALAILALLLVSLRLARKNFKKELEGIKAAFGRRRPKDVLNGLELRLLTVHEAGHAVVMWFTPGHPPPEAVTIVAEGKNLGHVDITAPPSRFITPSQDVAYIASLLGSYAAEELFFGEASSACNNDIRIANEMAESLALRRGTNRSNGPIAPGYLTDLTDPFFAEAVGKEVVRIISTQYGLATKIVGERRAEIELIAAALLARRTLTTKDLEELLGPRPNGN